MYSSSEHVSQKYKPSCIEVCGGTKNHTYTRLITNKTCNTFQPQDINLHVMLYRAERGRPYRWFSYAKFQIQKDFTASQVENFYLVKCEPTSLRNILGQSCPTFKAQTTLANQICIGATATILLARRFESIRPVALKMDKSESL